ncbi:hypothetical protein D3C86_1603820 [compost metagenome]
MSLRRAPGDGQAQAMSGRSLPRRPIERLTELAQIFGTDPGPVIAHGHDDPLALTQCLHFDRQATHRIETLGVAQQIVHGPFDHGRPALQIQLRFGFEVDQLLG